MLKSRKLLFFGLVFGMVFSMSVNVFASGFAKNEAIACSHGYTYWKVQKKATGETVRGPERVVIIGPEGRSYRSSIRGTVRELLNTNISLGLFEAMEASFSTVAGIDNGRIRDISGLFGGKKNNSNKLYEVRSWSVYDVYEVKGKEYQSIDGYEIPTGNSFGYYGDKKKAYTVKKYKDIAFGDDFLVK